MTQEEKKEYDDKVEMEIIDDFTKNMDEVIESMKRNKPIDVKAVKAEVHAEQESDPEWQKEQECIKHLKIANAVFEGKIKYEAQIRKECDNMNMSYETKKAVIALANEVINQMKKENPDFKAGIDLIDDGLLDEVERTYLYSLQGIKM